MHDEPRQDRLPRVLLELTGALASGRLAEHLWRPARQARLNDLPRALDRKHELARLPRSFEVILPPLARVRERRFLGARLLENPAQPVDTSDGNVAHDCPDRPPVR